MIQIKSLIEVLQKMDGNNLVRGGISLETGDKKKFNNIIEENGVGKLQPDIFGPDWEF